MKTNDDQATTETTQTPEPGQDGEVIWSIQRFGHNFGVALRSDVGWILYDSRNTDEGDEGAWIDCPPKGAAAFLVKYYLPKQLRKEIAAVLAGLADGEEPVIEIA